VRSSGVSGKAAGVALERGETAVAASELGDFVVDGEIDLERQGAEVGGGNAEQAALRLPARQALRINYRRG
jgi:hypothetical protein